MENKNNKNLLISFKNFLSKTIRNKRTSNKFKKIKLNIKTKTINTNHKKAKSYNKYNKNKNKQKENNQNYFKNNYIDNSDKITKTEIQKKKLDSIDLIEKNTKNIYDWELLLNNPNLGLYYKKEEYKKLEENTGKKEIKNKLPKNPVLLVDLTENELKKYFPKKTISKFISNFQNRMNNSNSLKTINEKNKKNNFPQKRAITEINNEIKDKKIISHNIRPVSIYSIRKPEETFYYSNDFNDYYHQDLKQFSEKMPLLKARINASNKKLKKEIIKQRIKSSKEEKILNEVIKNVENEKIKFKKLDLIIAGERKNVEPLLKNIYHQQNPLLKKINEHIKMYYKTMKPYGNNKDNIDYTKNERWRPSMEIKYLREKYIKTRNNVGTSTDNYDLMEKYNYDYFNRKPKLILSYYNNDDPDIKFFDYLVKRNKSHTMNNNNELYYQSINDDDKIKEKIYLTTFQNNNNDIYKNPLIKEELYNFPFIIEQYKQYEKYNKESNQEEENNLDKSNNNNNQYNYFITEGNKSIFNEY